MITYAIVALVFLAIGVLIGANNPVRVKLVSERIEDVGEEAFHKAVEASIDRLKKL